MQDNQLSLFTDRFNKGLLLKIAKLVVTLLIVSYIYKTLRQDQYNFENLADSLISVFRSENYIRLLFLLLLVPANWALESLKWMFLARAAVPISFVEAFRSTLTGLAFGVAVPAQVGDTIGRVASLKSHRRLASIGAALVSNGVQFYIAIVAGFFALIQIQDKLSLDPYWMKSLIILLVTLIIIGIGVGIWRKKLIRFNTQKKWGKKLTSYLRVIGEYQNRDLLRALFIGSMRYLVFLIQFILALSLFQLDIAIVTLIAPTALLLLAKTLIPALNTIGDLGIRGIVILWVFENYHLPSESLIAATLIIWIVNILGPISAGLVMIWKYNWKFS